jgi:hypothetical protein
MRNLRKALVVGLVAGTSLALPACGISTPSSNTVENFSGSLAVGGINSHEFRAGRTGEIEVTVTELSPESGVFIGVGYGQMISGQCQLISRYDFARVGQLAMSQPISSGQFCAFIYDPGSFTQTNTYTLRVSHP